MKDTQTQLSSAAEAYQQLRYPGDLAEDVQCRLEEVRRRRRGRRRWTLAAAASIAIAVCLLPFHGRPRPGALSLSSTAPQPTLSFAALNLTSATAGGLTPSGIGALTPRIGGVTPRIRLDAGAVRASLTPQSRHTRHAPDSAS